MKFCYAFWFVFSCAKKQLLASFKICDFAFNWWFWFGHNFTEVKYWSQVLKSSFGAKSSRQVQEGARPVYCH
jgi:hypothetical protein